MPAQTLYETVLVFLSIRPALPFHYPNLWMAKFEHFPNPIKQFISPILLAMFFLSLPGIIRGFVKPDFMDVPTSQLPPYPLKCDSLSNLSLLASFRTRSEMRNPSPSTTPYPTFGPGPSYRLYIFAHHRFGSIILLTWISLFLLNRVTLLAHQADPILKQVKKGINSTVDCVSVIAVAS